MAFNNLKEEILKPMSLQQPNYSFPFILETDASNLDIGAILSQKVNGEELPIAYASHML